VSLFFSIIATIIGEIKIHILKPPLKTSFSIIMYGMHLHRPIHFSIVYKLYRTQRVLVSFDVMDQFIGRPSPFLLWKICFIKVNAIPIHFICSRFCEGTMANVCIC